MSSSSSSSYIRRNQNSMILKKRIAAIYGPDILYNSASLYSASMNREEIVQIRKEDSADVREKKNKQNNLIIAAREAEYSIREPEIINELEKIMERIRIARQEYDASLEVDGKKNLVGGAGLYSSSNAAAMSMPNFECESCGNKDPNNIHADPLRGDSICMGRDGKGCGNVVQDHFVVQGAEKRNFEGEEDQKHFGPAPNKFMPDSDNMKTNLCVTGLGISGKKEAAFTNLVQTMQTVEMNLSTIGNDDKRTRQGYKNNQKRVAFSLMEEIAANLNIHLLVVEQAKEEFTKYREVREALHHFEGSVAACLVIAYEDLAEVMSEDSLRVPTTSYMSLEEQDRLQSNGAGDALAAFKPHADVTNDFAICTVSDSPLMKFTLEQVRVWLEAIVSNADTTASNKTNEMSSGESSIRSSANGSCPVIGVAQWKEVIEAVCQHISQLQQKQEQSAIALGKIGRGSGKYPSSDAVGIFGNTSMAGRISKYSGASGKSSSVSSIASGVPSGVANAGTGRKQLTAGQLLQRIKVCDVIRATGAGSGEDRHTVEEYLRKCIFRRANYDSLKVAADEAQSLQKRRLLKEKNNFGVASKSTTASSTGGSVVEAKEAMTEEKGEEGDEEDEDDEDFDMEDFIGGSVAVTNSKYLTSKGSGNSAVATSLTHAQSSQSALQQPVVSSLSLAPASVSTSATATASASALSSHSNKVPRVASLGSMNEDKAPAKKKFKFKFT